MMRPMPRVPPFDRPATYEDLVKLPDHVVAEIVDGELHASSRPAPAHAIAGSSLGIMIGGPYSFGRGGPGGWWMLYEPELHLGADVLVPDSAGWRRTRLPRLPDTAFCVLPPDWVCEVLSPSTTRLDRTQKLGVYA
jgi:Uma2 family endonuclease